MEKEKQKKEEKEKPKKTKASLNLIIAITIIVILLSSIMFVIKLFTPTTMDDLIQEIIEKGETKQGYMYNGFVFVEYEGLWHTKLQRGTELYNLHFHYSPAHVDQIPVIGSLDSELDTSEFYITLDPLEDNISLIALSSSELSLNLVKGMGAKIKPACYRNESEACYGRPIITCDNTEEAVIFVKTAEETQVLLESNCITIQGEGDNLLKAVDKVLFDFYGIVENPTS